jgi:hypothetical protein
MDDANTLLFNNFDGLAGRSHRKEARSALTVPREICKNLIR